MGENFKEAIDMLYRSKEDLLIVGLTGRTGAGCSTAANILKQPYDKLDFQYEKRQEYDSTEVQKFHIIKHYIEQESRWCPFEVIEGSCVILSYVFESENANAETLINYLNTLEKGSENVHFKITDNIKLHEDLRGMKHCFEAVNNRPLKDDLAWDSMGDEEFEEYYDLYIKKLPLYKNTLKKIMSKYSCFEIETGKMEDKEPVKYHLYTYFLQKMGNNIRSSGNPFISKFDASQILNFAKRLGQLVDLIICRNKRNKKCTRICIDAIRNENESNFLKDRYRPYYLLAIGVDEGTRRKRLQELNVTEKDSIDQIEYLGNYKAERFFYQQNIARCIELADIHIYNEQVEKVHKFFLTWQLIKYVTLMIHPGLITPTRLERCMQLAYIAKLNSGCLSRQVGAIVTDKNCSVKAVGWNDVPQGQMPCNLRNIELYSKGNHSECFSCYEMEEQKFRETIASVENELKDKCLGGREFPICFKDIYNGYTHERNQVYTRSLHAEENAFLQISKYGGTGIDGGKLFVTASPCELCSKKSYQLGITDIYYIDPYPGIAERHIIRFGKGDKGPQCHLFYGAIGEAYVCLYKPLMAYKDELEMVSGINCKKIAETGILPYDTQPKTMDIEYETIEFVMRFNSRESIESVRDVNFTVKEGHFSKLARHLVWTGTSYDGTELLDAGYKIKDCHDNMSPYHYIIDFGKDMMPGDKVAYKLRSKVKDETHMMHPYLAHFVKYPTKKLIIRLETPLDQTIIENVRYKRYADKEMKYDYPECAERTIETNKKDGYMTYTIQIDSPNLFYSYALEWDFIKIRD